MHCHLPAATHNVRSHWMSPADGPASPSCTRAMPQAVTVAYTASTLGAAARCSKSTSFLPLMPLSRLVARHSRMLSRSYGGRVCGAVACVWPVLTRLLSVPCLGHNNRTRGAAQGPSKPRNRQMSQPGSPRAGPSLRIPGGTTVAGACAPAPSATGSAAAVPVIATGAMENGGHYPAAIAYDLGRAHTSTPPREPTFWLSEVAAEHSRTGSSGPARPLSVVHVCM